MQVMKLWILYQKMKYLETNGSRIISWASCGNADSTEPEHTAAKLTITANVHIV